MTNAIVNTLYLYTDGGARGNPGPAAIGAMICDEDGETLQDHSDYIGQATNNVAEYCALIAGFELARQLGASKLICRTDSELVCRQMSGQYRIKSPEMKKLYRAAKELEVGFESVRFEHVPRTHDHIRKVDRLVNQVLDRHT